jgi:phosphate-selective porin OprO/OprP
MRKHSIGIFVLMALFLSGSAAGQEKKEPPPVTTKRSLQISGYAQFLYTYWEDGIDTFSIPRARLGLSGELLKNVRFRIQIDGVKSPSLMDAEFDILFKPYLGLRIGQYYVPFSRENTTSDRDMDTILRSQVVISLAPSRDIGSQGRDIGAMFMGKYSIIEYFAGVFNGSGINKLDTNRKKDLSARLILHPTEYLAVGGSLYTGRHSPTQGTPAVTRDRAGLEAAFLPGKFSLKSEFIFGKDDQISKSGWYLQGGYYFVPQKLQALLKWDSYDKDADVIDDRTDLLTFGVNWFLLDKTKLMLNYNLYAKEGEGKTNQAISIQFQAAF